VESTEHQRLKELGLRFLLELGCAAAATEVRCPRSRYQADVAGYLDTRPVLQSSQAERRELDFLKDARDRGALLERRRVLDARRRQLEREVIRDREPHLRDSGTFLFEELEGWDFGASRSPAYRRVLRELRSIDRALHGETKFWLASRYRLADRLYLLAPAGMVGPRERPPGWGLIELPEGLLSRRKLDERDRLGAMRIAAVAPERSCGEIQRLRLLRNIAAAATRRTLALSPSEF